MIYMTGAAANGITAGCDERPAGFDRALSAFLERLPR
jgi:hypothetical protein